jgi:UDP-glucose 4-epimerase
VAKFIKKALHGEAIEIYGDGNQTRDFIYIKDLVRAILLAVSAPKAAGETFQIATSCEHTVNELVGFLKDVLKKFDSGECKILHTEPRRGDVRRNYSDTSKAHQMLHWQADIELVEGLLETVNWFVKQI